MTRYFGKSLHKFHHPQPKRPQNSSHDWTIPAYGSKFQYTQTKLDLLSLEPSGTQQVQSIAGTLLYYSRAVRHTMIPALNNIYTQQSKPTANTINKCNRLLDYASAYPNNPIRYHASDMILHVDTDVAYLVLTKSRSLIAIHLYLRNLPPTNDTPKPKLNSPIITICQTLKNVVASSAEAETEGIFLNGQSMLPIQHTLVTMDHLQPENGNPLKSDRKTGIGIT